MSEYQIGQLVRVLCKDFEEDLTVGSVYEVVSIDAEDSTYCVGVFGDHDEHEWLASGTFELVTNNQGPDNQTNPFESINTKSLSHLLDLAGRLVAAYDDCDESTKQMIPLVLKIGGIEVKRES